ncbi:MAG: ABC transporter transmembrane domain-containing protein, partial [Traorella sp.]
MKKKKGVLWPYIWKYKIQYLLGLFTLLMVDYLNLFIPQITGEIVDGLTVFSLDLKGILLLVASLLVVALLISVGRVGWRVFIFGTSRKIEFNIRNDMFEKLEDLSQNYFNTHKTGDLMTHFTNDLEALRNSIGPAIISAFDAIVMTIMV